MSDPSSGFKLFLSELRRRNVVRVGLAYVLVGWIVVEAADTIFPNLGLPPWTVTLVIALGLAGFPVALVLAWVLELTPDGVRRTSSLETTPVSAATRSKSWPILWGALVVAVVAVAGFFLVRRASGTAEQINSVAVLPFDDLTAAVDQAYFGTGIAEEILNALSRVDGLRVPSRTTTTILAESGLVVQEIGRRLNVEAILGEVRRAQRRSSMCKRRILRRTSCTSRAGSCSGRVYWDRCAHQRSSSAGHLRSTPCMRARTSGWPLRMC